ncbi:LytTR family DNA-binding domain-containing protein [uncultured Aquimarina sp.]|uniref:LytR/AlgR family response regulator transcription factor n=1 Tax=uncultured Aquimarina sp. TaxID=575652 RepID=UPI00260EBA72|nr:LytTR family DNA-binding domain-containing protein [uncultured Aquimarina sp.]
MIKRLKTVIIDDEPSGIENLEELITQFCPQLEIINTGETLEEAKSIIDTIDFDLIFLDVQIGNSTIFDVISKLKKKTFEIIFISAHNHALKAFKYDAVDYLLKPIDIKKLIDAVNRANLKISNDAYSNHAKDVLSKIKQPNTQKEYIPVPTADGYEMIKANSILYCIADGSYTQVVTKDRGSIIGSQNLKYYEELLKSFSFIRIHHSSLINSEFIKRISRTDGGCVTMEDGKVLSISKSKKEETFKKLFLK